MPRTDLAVAEDAYRLLVCQPSPLTFDGRLIDGLGRLLPLDELRDLLVAGIDPDTCDAIWRQLATHAREWGAQWRVGVVGVALPGLTKMAAHLSAGRRQLAEDIDSALLIGFLELLYKDELTKPRLWLRLQWSAWRAAAKVCQTEDLLELPADVPVGSRTPYRPYGHPDLVLGRAVAAGIITDAQAELIGSTRLGDVLIEQIAAECGRPGSVVRMRRKRAERKLVAAVQRGETSGAVVGARFADNKDEKARRNGGDINPSLARQVAGWHARRSAGADHSTRECRSEVVPCVHEDDRDCTGTPVGAAHRRTAQYEIAGDAVHQAMLPSRQAGSAALPR